MNSQAGLSSNRLSLASGFMGFPENYPPGFEGRRKWAGFNPGPQKPLSVFMVPLWFPKNRRARSGEGVRQDNETKAFLCNPCQSP